MDLTRVLPEECLVLIISSLSSPVDVCRSAMVCPILRSVANSDAVWQNFLPSDYKSIVSGSSSSSSLLSLGRKDLYSHLSFNPILIQNGTMSFQLEKKTGKKCYMLGSRALSITWGDTTAYWTWTSLPESSRFPNVAELRVVWWLDVRGKIDSGILSSKTNYAAYLVFKLKVNHTSGFRKRPVGLKVHVDGVASNEMRRVSLDPSRDEPRDVRDRGDGWMEVEMGEFLNECGDDGVVECVLREVDTGYGKQGLIIEGIEFRPKDCGS